MSNDSIEKEIEIRCRSNKEKMRVSKLIHDQLVGNEDYIHNNIILNHEEDCKVLLVIFTECEEIPTITI